MNISLFSSEPDVFTERAVLPVVLLLVTVTLLIITLLIITLLVVFVMTETLLKNANMKKILFFRKVQVAWCSSMQCNLV